MIDRIDTSRDAVRRTGTAFLIAAVVVSGFLLWKHGHGAMGWLWTLAGGLILFAGSRIAYPLFKPVHVGWMWLAHMLGWVSTRVILTVFFYLILTPVGLFFKITGRDLLDRRIDRSARTYWRKRETSAVDPRRMEHQF